MMSTQQNQQPTIGVLEWFHFGDHERAERCVDDLAALGVRHLRTGVSWADWMRPDGRAWYEWLMPALSAKLDVLPCFSYTPPSLGEFSGTNAPPRRPEDYGDFVCYFTELLGEHFEWAELWNEPDNHREWNAAFDSDYAKFARMVGHAARWVKKLHGKKVLLGGLANADPNFLSLLHDHGQLEPFDAVGVHGFPHSFEFYWDGWAKRVGRLRERLDWCGSAAELWITETGYSTWRHDEQPQLAHFLDAASAPVGRTYWYCLQDLAPDRPTVDGFHSDEREYHFGLKTAGGRDKLLGRLWRDKGVAALPAWARRTRRRAPATDKKVDLIVGGAGFVGVNLAARLAAAGRPVLVYDNLSRPGVEDNLAWLQDAHPAVEFVCGDVLDTFSLNKAVRRAGRAFHFAAQVAVTTSLEDPAHDFDVNCRGTFNVLEACRAARGGGAGVPLLFTSTNKVYGGMDDVPLTLAGDRYAPTDAALSRHGVPETRCLDFHSPYGCSKGAADQYVVDYARCMGVPAVVFRMSCVYGPHQCGTEDQGWVAHFARAALAGQTVNLYGDGCQVRDVLYVDDLLDAMLLAHEHMPALSGRAFNVGGGPAQAVSLLDVLGHLGEAVGGEVSRRLGDWRTGDQRWYVSDTRAFTAATGWRPAVRPAQGLRRLLAWQRGKVPAAELARA